MFFCYCFFNRKILTNKVPGHFLVLLYTADIGKLQQRVDVVGVQLQQSLHGKKRQCVSIKFTGVQFKTWVKI